jgi:hypothetical protein
MSGNEVITGFKFADKKYEGFVESYRLMAKNDHL